MHSEKSWRPSPLSPPVGAFWRHFVPASFAAVSSPSLGTQGFSAIFRLQEDYPDPCSIPRGTTFFTRSLPRSSPFSAITSLDAQGRCSAPGLLLSKVHQSRVLLPQYRGCPC